MVGRREGVVARRLIVEGDRCWSVGDVRRGEDGGGKVEGGVWEEG